MIERAVCKVKERRCPRHTPQRAQREGSSICVNGRERCCNGKRAIGICSLTSFLLLQFLRFCTPIKIVARPKALLMIVASRSRSMTSNDLNTNLVQPGSAAN